MTSGHNVTCCRHLLILIFQDFLVCVLKPVHFKLRYIVPDEKDSIALSSSELLSIKFKVEGVSQSEPRSLAVTLRSRPALVHGCGQRLCR